MLKVTFQQIPENNEEVSHVSIRGDVNNNRKSITGLKKTPKNPTVDGDSRRRAVEDEKVWDSGQAGGVLQCLENPVSQ